MKRKITSFLALLILLSVSIEAGCNSCNAPTPILTTRDPYCYSCEQVCPGECHFFIGGEGLWWTVCENDLDFAIDYNNLETNILGIGRTHFAEYDWNWGARGWIGWNWCCGWDTAVVYTWFKTDGSKLLDRQESDLDLKASVLHPSTGISDAEIATANLDLKYQTLDLLFGRTVTYCQNSLVLRPFFGARGLKLNQEQEYFYEGGEFDAAPARVSWESTLKAGGLIAGADINFRWPTGLGIFGSVAGSILAARTDVEHLQEILDVNNEVAEIDIDMKEEQWIGVPGIHLQGGFNYHWSCGGCLLVEFHVLYEFNAYFNTPHLRRYSFGNEGVSSSATAGNVCLQGLTFGGGIYF